MKVIKDGSPPWEWPEITVVAFKADYDDIIALILTEADESADTTGARGTRDQNVATLIEKAQLGAGSLRIKHRNDPPKLQHFRGLKLDANSIQGKVTQAIAFESAWRKGDPTYVLEDGTTLAQFSTLRALCGTNQLSVGDELAEESEVSAQVRENLQKLYDLAVAWYGVATLKYPEGTARGDFIRGFIPTAPTAGGAVPEQAIITGEPGIGQAVLTVVATGASRFTIRYRPVGTTDWIDVVVAHETGSFTHTGLGAGFYEYMAIGHNNNGDGPESEVVTVEVTETRAESRKQKAEMEDGVRPISAFCFLLFAWARARARQEISSSIHRRMARIVASCAKSFSPCCCWRSGAWSG